MPQPVPWIEEIQKFDKLLSEFRTPPGAQLKTPEDIRRNAAKIYRASTSR